MWFCCQIWQCNFKTCLGPLEIWKTWNGWSHIVYPSKGTAESNTFTETRSGEGPSVLYVPSTSNEGPHLPPLDNIEEENSSDTSDETPRKIKDESKRESSPLPVQDERVGSPPPAQEADIDETVEVKRVASTDLSKMEEHMEYFREIHSKMIDQEENPNRVSYNDTGSLEEVNHGHQVEYFLQSNEEMDDPRLCDDLQYQYRQLWGLRAKLEQSISNEGSIDEASRSYYQDLYKERRDDSLRRPEEMSHMVRRQMLINLVNVRARDMNPFASSHQDSTSFEGCHESMDTEGYQSDTSYQEPRSGKNHCLQQLRSDSGYKSLEAAPSSQSFSLQQIEVVSTPIKANDKLGEIVEDSPNADVSTILKPHNTSSMDSTRIRERPQTVAHRSASKRRREFGITRRLVSAEYGTIGEKSKVRDEDNQSDLLAKNARLERTALYPRKDFCVDPRTDQLFQYYTTVKAQLDQQLVESLKDHHPKTQLHQDDMNGQVQNVCILSTENLSNKDTNKPVITIDDDEENSGQSEDVIDIAESDAEKEEGDDDDDDGDDMDEDERDDDEDDDDEEEDICILSTENLSNKDTNKPVITIDDDEENSDQSKDVIDLVESDAEKEEGDDDEDDDDEEDDDDDDYDIDYEDEDEEDDAEEYKQSLSHETVIKNDDSDEEVTITKVVNGKTPIFVDLACDDNEDRV